MNLDLKTLMAVPDSDRVKTFWTLMGENVPLATLFLAGSRLKDKGFSWAPASFLSCAKAGNCMDILCSISQEGLRAKLGPYTAFEVDKPQYLTEDLFPCILRGCKYFIKKNSNKANPSWEGLDLQRTEPSHNLRGGMSSQCFPGGRHICTIELLSYNRLLPPSL